MELYHELIDMELKKDSNNHIIINDNNYSIIKNLYLKPKKRLIKLNEELFMQKTILVKETDRCIDYATSLQHGVDFINHFFKFHDVNYLKNGYLLQKGSPFSIDIEKSDDFGYIVCQTNIYENNEEEVMFSKIILPKLNNLLLPLIYTHELTHSQLYSIQGSVNNINYDELIPIFMEYLYIFETNSIDISQIHNYYRLGDLLDYSNDIRNANTDTEDYILSSKYYVSTLLAYKLFYIYVTSNTNTRKEIINNIQKIFDGNRSVDETIKVYKLN